jgi:glycosyltransferase involved in cell wall biosynthesis
MSDMRVAQVLISPRIGGAETLASRLETEWLELNIESRLLYLDPDDTPRSRWRRLRDLRRAFRHYRPTVVLAHSALPNVYSRLAATRGLPVVTVLHSAIDDFADPQLRVAERVLQRRTALVVAVTEELRSEYWSHFGEDAPVIVVPNGVDTTGPRKHEYSRTPSRVVTVARVALQKNPTLWLEVADLAADAGIGADFVWFGPESEAAVTVTLRAGTEGRANAHYPGPTDQAVSEMLAADILFHPADREAQSVVLVEAASVGLPVVCAEHIDRALPLPVAAATFQAGDPRSALEALTATVQSYEQVAERARALVDPVRNTYSMAATARRYRDALEHVIGSGRPGAMTA